MLAGTRRLFSCTGSVCRSVHDSVDSTKESLEKQNLEVNYILVNLASYFYSTASGNTASSVPRHPSPGFHHDCAP